MWQAVKRIPFLTSGFVCALGSALWLLLVFAARCFDGWMERHLGFLAEGVWLALTAAGISLFVIIESHVSRKRRLWHSVLSKLALAVAMFCVSDSLRLVALPVRQSIDAAEEQAHRRDYASVIAWLQSQPTIPSIRYGATRDGSRYTCAPDAPLQVFFRPAGAQRIGYLYDPTGGALQHDYETGANLNVARIEVIDSLGNGWYRCRYASAEGD